MSLDSRLPMRGHGYMGQAVVRAAVRSDASATHHLIDRERAIHLVLICESSCREVRWRQGNLRPSQCRRPPIARFLRASFVLLLRAMRARALLPFFPESISLPESNSGACRALLALQCVHLPLLPTSLVACTAPTAFLCSLLVSSWRFLMRVSICKSSVEPWRTKRKPCLLECRARRARRVRCRAAGSFHGMLYRTSAI